MKESKVVFAIKRFALKNYFANIPVLFLQSAFTNKYDLDIPVDISFHHNIFFYFYIYTNAKLKW